MIFTTKAEYGVRLLVELGRHHGDRPVSLKAIAEAEGLPLAYLERIVALLKKAELVESTRGAHGGYRLARDPAAVHMDEVVLALEGAVAPMSCFVDDSRREAASCARTSPTTGAAARRACSGCASRAASWSARDTTLAELVAFAGGTVVPRARGPSTRLIRTARDLATNRRPWPTSRSATCTSAPATRRSSRAGPHRRQGRGPRADGPQRLGQVDAGQRDHGPAQPRGDRGLRSSSRARTSPRPTPTSAPAWASSWPSSTRSRSPA